MRLGIIGFGNRMQVVYKQMKELIPECKVTAVMDNRNEEIKTQMGVEAEHIIFFNTVEEMLENAELDGIMIGTRCTSHTKMALKAMLSGLPIFLEKPVATTFEDLIRLKKGYESSKSPILVSFPLRLTPLARAVKEILDSDQIGTVEHIQAVNNVPYGHVYFKKWYRNEKETGGLFLQKATHDLDVIHYLTGAEPKTVCAMFSKQINIGNKPAGLKCQDCEEKQTCPESTLRGEYCSYAVDTGNEDSSSALIRYASGMHASYSQNFFVRRAAGRRGMSLMGYKGTIKFDWYDNKIRVMMHHSSRIDTIQLDTNNGHHFGGDRALIQNLSDVIRLNAKPLASLDDGMLSALVCMKTIESAGTNQFVDIEWK